MKDPKVPITEWDIDDRGNVPPYGNAVAKEGTSEGAKLGWETRREGGQAEEKKPDASSFETPPENWQQSLPYQHRLNLGAWTEWLTNLRMSHVYRQGGEAKPYRPEFADVAARREVGRWLDRNDDKMIYHISRKVDISHGPRDEKIGEAVGLVQEIVRMAQAEARREAETQAKKNPLSGVLFGKARVVGGFPLTQEDALAKEGTSEGAKKGWETRREGGGALSEEERKRAIRSLEVRGAADRGDVSVKIVPLLTGEGFGVETTVAGDRRNPREPAMTMEEARRFALEQLQSPRPTQTPEMKPKPEAEEKKPSPTPVRPYRNPGDLAADYKRQGIPKQRAWDQFIIDTVLSPKFRSEQVDAREFFQAYDRA
jgi:hypothetical protein